MLRITPNTLNQSIARTLDQRNLEANHNHIHHYSRQKLIFKPTLNKSIEESKKITVRTNSHEDSSSQIKLRRIVGDGQLHKQLSRNNISGNSSPLSKSPYNSMIKKPRKSLSEQRLIDSMRNLDRQLQVKVAEINKLDGKDSLIRGVAVYKNTLCQLLREQEQDVVASITNNLIELLAYTALLQMHEYKVILNDLKKNNDVLKQRFNSLETERDVLLETIQQLKTNSQSTQTGDSNQLREINHLQEIKIQEMLQKEHKLIQLVQAIKSSGVDVEKIYNEEVLNEDEESISAINMKHIDIPRQLSISYNQADDSIINDSQESSFQFKGRDNEQIIESVRQFEARIINRNPNYKPTSVKMKLDIEQFAKVESWRPK